MPSNHTPNYKLSQWEAEDRVQRTDFNADNAKLDAAIAAAAAKAAEMHVYVGSFQGDGTDNRVIQLPFKPKFVIIFGKFSDDDYISFLTQDFFAYIEKYSHIGGIGAGPKISGNTLIFQDRIWYNKSGDITSYIAFQ